MTMAFSSASFLTIASPIPLLLPVTNAFLPLKFKSTRHTPFAMLSTS
jgi:hypothetical protein